MRWAGEILSCMRMSDSSGSVAETPEIRHPKSSLLKLRREPCSPGACAGSERAGNDIRCQRSFQCTVHYTFQASCEADGYARRAFGCESACCNPRFSRGAYLLE